MAWDFCFFLASHSSSFQPCIACSLKLHFNFMFFQLKLKAIKLKWPQQRSLCYLAVFEGFRQRNAECIYFSELKWSAHSVCCLFLLLPIRIITICLFFAWTGISGRSSPMCLFTVAKQSIIIIIKHPGNLPPQPQDAHMHRPTQRPYHRIHTHNRYNCTFISLPFTLFTTRRKEQVASLEMASKSTGLL